MFFWGLFSTRDYSLGIGVRTKSTSRRDCQSDRKFSGLQKRKRWNFRKILSSRDIKGKPKASRKRPEKKEHRISRVFTVRSSNEWPIAHLHEEPVRTPPVASGSDNLSRRSSYDKNCVLHFLYIERSAFSKIPNYKILAVFATRCVAVKQPFQSLFYIN